MRILMEDLSKKEKNKRKKIIGKDSGTIIKPLTSKKFFLWKLQRLLKKEEADISLISSS